MALQNTSRSYAPLASKQEGGLKTAKAKSRDPQFSNFLKTFRPNGRDDHLRPYQKEDYAKFSVSEWRSLSFGYNT